MARYRVGRSWGVTVVRERPGQPDQLVGTMQTAEDAQLIVNALNLMDETQRRAWAKLTKHSKPTTPSKKEGPA